MGGQVEGETGDGPLTPPGEAAWAEEGLKWTAADTPKRFRLAGDEPE
jgi:hypothetical protein